jgi:hypothetical protein
MVTYSQERERRQPRHVAAAARWPIDRASLAALGDLGLSDEQIAAYFDIRPADVTKLHLAFGV